MTPERSGLCHYTFAVQARRTTYETIVWSRRGQAHTRCDVREAAR
jgi:hypothetical protein